MKDKNRSVIHQIIASIYKELDSDISLEHFSQKHQISAFHLLRLFKEETGKTLYEFVQAVRLQYAALMIISTPSLPIAYIATKSGYASHASFIRAFKKRFKKTPMQWKKFHHTGKQPSIVANASVVTVAPKQLLYQRSKGVHTLYHSWQKFKSKILKNGLKEQKQIMIFDDNPYLTKERSMHYRVAMEVDTLPQKHPMLHDKSEEFLALRMNLEGNFDEVFALIKKLFSDWLPTSGYHLQALPLMLAIEKNPFYHGYKTFKAAIYLPI